MISCFVISFAAYFVFPKLLRKSKESYPKHWNREADEAVEWTKNYLSETR